MNRFNAYMSNHFSACKLLAESWDDSRKRDVRIYLMPGFSDCVGITDGTDSWVAPVSASCFSVNIARQLEDIQKGTFAVIRRNGPESMRRRRAVLLDAPAAPRKRLQLVDAPVIATRSRRALLA